VSRYRGKKKKGDRGKRATPTRKKAAPSVQKPRDLAGSLAQRHAFSPSERDNCLRLIELHARSRN
jgi:hypothetical protein